MRIQPFVDAASEVWDAHCDSSGSATFLHKRAFLSYHRNRFFDASLMVRDDGNKLLGVLPAAISLSDEKIVVSHPGSTYGGLIYSGRVSVSDVDEMLVTVFKWYQDHGFSKLLYKVTPAHVQRVNSAIDQYLLWKRGTLVRRDLWNVIQIDHSRTLSKGRKWGVNRGRKANIRVVAAESIADYRDFYDVLTINLKEKHETAPVHSLDEFLEISSRFPNETELWLVKDRLGSIAAGVWLFKLHTYCVHTQYIASTEAGRDLSAVDFLIESIIVACGEKGVRWFSFGASSEQGGRVVNDGLFDFKSGFGIGSLVQDFFEIDLLKS